MNQTAAQNQQDPVFLRVELHNHTVESDGQITVPQLADYFKENGILNFALTDHNTITGNPKMQAYLRSAPDTAGMRCVGSYELTSYYGHLLCHSISRYIPWDDIDQGNADLLFDRVHEAGGLVGVAHPFSFGSPIANGMRFTMKIHDFSKLDFIEIVNNAHPLVPDNLNAIAWWKDLVLAGYPIAATSGMDLHHPLDMTGFFTTYLLLPAAVSKLPLEQQLSYAVRSGKTCVTKGPILVAESREGFLQIRLERPGPYAEPKGFLLKITGRDGETVLPMDSPVIRLPLSSDISATSDASERKGPFVFELYQALEEAPEAVPENLAAVAALF